MATTRHVWAQYTRSSYSYYAQDYSQEGSVYAGSNYFYGFSSMSFSRSTGLFTLSGSYREVSIFQCADASSYPYGAVLSSRPSSGGALVGHCYYNYGSGTYYWNSMTNLPSTNAGTVKLTATTANSSQSYYFRRLYASLRSGYEQGSFLGYVSSSSSGAYPSNDYTGSYWYVKQGTDIIDPTSVSLPAEIFGGETTTITVSPSTGKQYSGTVSYIYQYRFNGGEWNGLTTSTSTSTTLAVPIGMNTVQVRVQAKDNLGFTSSTWVESNTVEVINGDPPYIQWGFKDNPHDMGQITEPFEFNYTVQDPDLGNTMTVDEALTYHSDDKLITIASHTYENVNIGTEIKYDALTSNMVNFQQCPTDDISTITISAIDNYKLQSEKYIVTFTKYIDEVTITLKTPLAVEGSITEAVIYVIGYIPSDAIFTMKATNNANDDTPIWQDVTDDVLHRRVFKFDNLVAENGYAFNFELYAKRGESKEKGFIDEIMGAFK